MSRFIARRRLLKAAPLTLSLSSPLAVPLSSALLSTPAVANPLAGGGPINMVIAFAPGGSVDTVARPLAERMTKDLSQSVVVMNRPGGQTNIATQSVISAAPDGRTIYFASSSILSNPHFGPDPKVDILDALVPLTAITSVPFVIAAHPSLPVDDPKGLVALAQREPGKLTIASAGLERSAWELGRGTKTRLTHIAYRGGAQATTDTIAGHTNLVIASVPVLLPFIRRGELKAIGVCAEQRAEVLPEVPTFAEAGFKDWPIAAWYGLFAPKGVPADVAAALAGAARRATEEREFLASMISQGVTVLGGSPQDLDRLRRRTFDDFRALAQEYPRS